MKKTINIFLIMAIVVIIMSVFNQVFAVIDPNDYQPGEMTGNDSKTIVAKASIILGAIRNISVVVSVIILMVIGFKYIIGSVEQKANYKQTMVPYIIGCIMAVAGTTIVSFIYNAVHWKVGDYNEVKNVNNCVNNCYRLSIL